MKAISRKQHKALIAALQHLAGLSLAANQTSEVFETSDVSMPAGGFLQHIQSLGERFAHYEALLVELVELHQTSEDPISFI